MSRMINKFVFFLIYCFISEVLSRRILSEVCQKYQKSDINALATFTLNDISVPPRTVYVTDKVSFTTTNTAIGSIAGAAISGVAPGRVTVGVKIFGGTEFMSVTNDNVTVTDDSVHVDKLSVIVSSGIQPTKSCDNCVINSTNAQVEFPIEQSLTKPFDKASVSVFARFSDNTVQDVTNAALVSLPTDAVLDLFSVGASPLTELVPFVEVPADISYSTLHYEQIVFANWDGRTTLASQCSAGAATPARGAGLAIVNLADGPQTGTGAPSYSPTNSPAEIFNILAHLQPFVVVSSGFALPLPFDGFTFAMNGTVFGQVKGNTGAVFGRNFTELQAGDVSTDVEYSFVLNNRVYPDTLVSHPELNAAASISGLVRTSTIVTSDRTLALSYQLRDIHGSTWVNLENVTVTATVVNPITGAAYSTSCVLPDTVGSSRGSGIGYCQGSIPVDWFTDSFDGADSLPLTVTIQLVSDDQRTNIQSNPLPFTLVSLPTYAPLVVGAALYIPQYAKYTDSSFTTAVTANTAGNSLSSWNITVNYDDSVLEFISASANPIFDGFNIITGDGSVTFTSTGVIAGVSSKQTTGSTLSLLSSMTWHVLSGAEPGVYPVGMQVVVNSMEDDSSDVFLQNAYGYVYGEVETNLGSSPEELVNGQITVVGNEFVGLYAYTLQNELINDVWLTGVPVSTSIVVVAVPRKPTLDLAVITDFSSCTLMNDIDNDVTDIASCKLTVTADHTEGAAVPVLVEAPFVYASQSVVLSTTITFNIYAYSQLELAVVDDVLNCIV